MPAYQLARKLAVDGLVRAMVNCTRCADPAAPYYRTSCMVFGEESETCEASFEIAKHACGISQVACRANPVARRGYCGLLLEECLCKADCFKCECLGGTTQKGCIADCEELDREHDCVEPEETFDNPYGVWSY